MVIGDIKMKYFAHIRNKSLIDVTCVKYLDCINIEVDKEIYDNADRYIYDSESSSIILDPDYEEKQKQKERERILSLSIPQTWFWNSSCISPITREQTIKRIEDTIPSTLKETCLSEIYLEKYIRGSILIEVISILYGDGDEYITEEKLDNLFISVNS